MTKTKTILTALALTTALTAPVLVVPLLSAPPAIAGQAAPQDLSDLAAKVTPAVVNVAVTMKAGAADADETQMSDRSQQQDQMEEFMQPLRRALWPAGPARQAADEAAAAPARRPRLSARASSSTPSAGSSPTTTSPARPNSITVTLTDGRKLPAKLMGGDEKTDLALLKVESDKPLPFVTFADASKVRVGQPVMAVGNPFGLGGTVTTGIVSARGRDIHSGPFDDYIQTDAAINRGNSGGPLFDMDGKVIGINTAIFSPSGGSVGPWLRHPVEPGRAGSGSAQGHRRVERGLLGVQIQPVTEEIAQQPVARLRAKGALVAQVQPDSPALAAGIKSGDVIKSVDSKNIDDASAISRARSRASSPARRSSSACGATART